PRSTLFPYTTLFRSHAVGVSFINHFTPSYRQKKFGHFFRCRVSPTILLPYLFSALRTRVDFGVNKTQFIHKSIDTRTTAGQLLKDRKSTRLNSSHVK